MIYNFLRLLKGGVTGFGLPFYGVLLVCITSCTAKRNLTYMSDLQDTAVYSSKITNVTESHIKPGDILGITVTNVDPETNNLLNKGLLPVVNPVAMAGSTAVPDAPAYPVDKAGNISFPVVGKIKVDGLTTEEAVDKMGLLLSSFVKGPIITIRLLNFKVTVIGEVNKPGVFSIPAGKVNVLEALGMAGDMTVYGKRENVQVIHEENGIRTVSSLDLNNKSALQSPVFYLQQNDIVYIRPDKLKERQARTDTRTLSIVVAAATIITVIISRLF